LKNNTFTNLSPYYKDANVEWLEALKEYKTGVETTQFQNSVMKISVTPLHKIYNYILI